MIHTKIIVVKNPEDMGVKAADQFEAAIQSKPACVIGLATGSTPLPLYRELIARIEARENEPFSVARIRSAALLLLIDLCTKHACPEEGAQAQKNAALEHVKVALSYLNENYAHAVSLEQVADEVGITKFHLAREFKRYTGQTV